MSGHLPINNWLWREARKQVKTVAKLRHVNHCSLIQDIKPLVKNPKFVPLGTLDKIGLPMMYGKIIYNAKGLYELPSF